ncbi:hypothetical protein [Colwellia sp. BRX8-9]|jgi:hypothetical protein|uniref:hypothetical protein n=1 Tax=Colwellia sp. BRX8-9 TaxID=2759831 RepID=UPI0015F6231D|nr:hypothetical protein [Colwellia sp. BRX8-9]MBA6350050.1 hypothetical protein [Colwellia sp. BRX8-9]
MEYITVFFGSLLTVYMLGINSQLVRDKNCIGAFSLAWFISLSNMLYIKVFVMSDEFMLTYLCSALGSGIGIVLSIVTYSKVETYLKKKSILSNNNHAI